MTSTMVFILNKPFRTLLSPEASFFHSHTFFVFKLAWDWFSDNIAIVFFALFFLMQTWRVILIQICLPVILRIFIFPFPCIHRFSRKILWLEVGPSNNDPAIVGRYFVECVALSKGKYETNSYLVQIYLFYIFRRVKPKYFNAIASTSFYRLPRNSPKWSGYREYNNGGSSVFIPT